MRSSFDKYFLFIMENSTSIRVVVCMLLIVARSSMDNGLLTVGCLGLIFQMIFFPNHRNHFSCSCKKGLYCVLPELYNIDEALMNSVSVFEFTIAFTGRLDIELSLLPDIE